MDVEFSSPDQSQGTEAPNLNPYRLPVGFLASKGKWKCVFREENRKGHEPASSLTLGFTAS